MHPLKSFLVGLAAERAARRHLRSRGFIVVETNVRLGRDEIDIVCVHEGTVVFVEVRYRIEGLGLAVESVGPDKVHSLRRAIGAYRTRERLWSAPARCDILAVTRHDGRFVMAHVVGGVDLFGAPRFTRQGG